MKRFIFVISMACLFFLSFTACGNGTSVKAQTSIDAVAKYLSSVTGGISADNPVQLAVKIDLQNMSVAESGWQQLLGVINLAGKYVALDLSDCSMSGTEFNPVKDVKTGKEFIASLVLPKQAGIIAAGLYSSRRGQSSSAFEYFTNLQEVIGESVYSIGDCAFLECSNLTSVFFPAATSIGAGAFERCGLISVSFPLATTIRDAAFLSCTSLTGVDIPVATTIADWLFNSCSLTSIIIPNGVTSIGIASFYDCSFTSIIIPSSVTSIGGQAFYECDNLNSVTFEGVISQNNFGSIPLEYFPFSSPFEGDLRTKYLAGGIGTYTTSNPGSNAVWTKQ